MATVPNGLLPTASAGVTRRVDPERWAVAEARTAELIARIQPNAYSEGRRHAVYNYVQRLIMSCLSCQVFTFGSVPLKTYLPDGDIDVTAFSNSEELKDTWANLVRDALEHEEKSENAEFCVKEVQCIQAEVKLIKCLVDNIVVDISFNQVGGLCTLCFLEEVLYRFLEFFSNFDWEKFCLSLWGPVPISSLPDMTGNFFRICSAFSFGAKRLTKLLECPKEDLIAGVNQLFTNTLIRHGSGNRPDAPTPNLIPEHALKVAPAEASNSHRGATMPKNKVENPKLRANQDNLAEGSHSYPELISQPPRRNDVYSRNSPRTVNPAVSHAQHQNVYAAQSNIKVSEQLERNRSGGSMQSERDRRMSNDLFVSSRNGQNRYPFARTRSSPELTDPSVEGYSHGRRTRVVEMEKSLKNDYNRRRNNLLSEVSSNHNTNHSTKSSQDESMSSMNSSSHPSAKAASDSNSVSNSYHEDNGFMMNEELPSVSEALEMQHEEQILVNLMASAKLHGFNGQVQLPMQIPSHLSVTSLPLLSPTAFPPKHFAGIPPTSLIRSPWLHNMQFLQGFVPPPLTHYAHNPTFAPNTEDGNECEKTITSDSNLDDGNNRPHGVRLSVNFNHEGRDPQVHHFDGKNGSSSPNGVSGAPLERKKGYTVQDNGVVEENYTNIFQNQISREVSINIPMSSGNVRIPFSQSSSSKNKALPESSWDERAGKTSRASKDKREKKACRCTTCHNHTYNKTGWQTGNTTEHLPTEVDEGARNGVVIPIIRSEASDIITGSGSFSEPSRTSQVPNDFDASQIGMPNPMFAPFLIGSPQQRQADKSELTFVPTGPPVPFVVLPFVPGNSDGSVPQFERNEGINQFPVNVAVQNFSSLKDVHQPDTNATSTASSSTVADPFDEHQPDILTSDFVSHWHNLQYGRLCQDARPQGPLLYPFAVPPVYLQGHVPWDGPGRPASPNINWTPMVGPGQRVFPVMPLQPASERATGVSQHYGEHAPRYRGGTGTYLPNRKVPFRDRDRYSSSRNNKGSYSSDKGDNSEKEGRWINSKHRNPGSSYGRSQSERSGLRYDRQTTDESQFDRQRRSYRNESYRHEAGAQYLVQGAASPPEQRCGRRQPSSSPSGARSRSASAMDASRVRVSSQSAAADNDAPLPPSAADNDAALLLDGVDAPFAPTAAAAGSSPLRYTISRVLSVHVEGVL